MARTRNIRLAIAAAFLLGAFFNCFPIVRAEYREPAPTVVHLMLYTSDRTVAASDRRQYSALGSRLPTVSVVTHYVNGKTEAQVRDILAGSISNNPGLTHMTVWGGHGVVGGMGTDSWLSKADIADITADSYTRMGVEGGMIMDCCGAGAIFTGFTDKYSDEAWGNMKYGIASSLANRLGWTPELGDNMRALISDATDKNGDGIITVGEMTDRMKEKGWADNKAWRIQDENAPMFAVSKEKMEEYLAQLRGFCAIVTPGEDTELGPVFGDKGVCQYEPGKSACGPFETDLGFQPAKTVEDALNYRLRTQDKLGHLARRNGKLSEYESTPHLGQQQKSNYEKTKESIDLKYREREITWLSGGENVSLPRATVEESLGDPKHAYTVSGGIKMAPGAYMRGGIYYDSEGKPVSLSYQKGSDICEFKRIQEDRDDDGFDGQGNGEDEYNGGGGGENGNGNGDDVLSRLLPALMQALQNNQRADQQNPQSGETEEDACPNTTDEVCGENGVTYQNACVAEKENSVKVSYRGACDESELKRTYALLSETAALIGSALTNSAPFASLNGFMQTLGNLIYRFIMTG